MWPFSKTHQPVHDPNRPFDIHTLYCTDTWTYPIMPYYLMPDNFWSQLLGVSIKVVAVGGIPAAGTNIILAINSHERRIFSGGSYLPPRRNSTSHFSWTLSGFTRLITQSAFEYDTALPDHLYLYPNDEITFTSLGMFAGDIISELTIRIKRWEFY